MRTQSGTNSQTFKWDNGNHLSVTFTATSYNPNGEGEAGLLQRPRRHTRDGPELLQGDGVRDVSANPGIDPLNDDAIRSSTARGSALGPAAR